MWPCLVVEGMGMGRGVGDWMRALITATLTEEKERRMNTGQGLDWGEKSFVDFCLFPAAGADRVGVALAQETAQPYSTSSALSDAAVTQERSTREAHGRVAWPAVGSRLLSLHLSRWSRLST